MIVRVLLLCTALFECFSASCSAGTLSSVQQIAKPIACQFENGEIDIRLPSAQLPVRAGLFVARAYDKSGRPLSYRLFPIQPAADQMLLLSADTEDDAVSKRIESVHCSFFPARSFDVWHATCPPQGGYWSTIVDNGPAVRLRSAVIEGSHVSFDVVVDWAATGSIAIKRLNGQSLFISSGPKVLIQTNVTGFAPQSVTVNAHIEPSGRYGFSIAPSRDATPQSVLCIPHLLF